MGRTSRAAGIALCVAMCVTTVLGVGGGSVAARVPTQIAAPTTQQPAAILTVISGDVLTRGARGDFSPAADGAVLYLGGSVRTSADARAVITLFEGSTVELEPGSDITIEEATTRSGSTIVGLAQSLGRTWHVVTHLTTADSRYEVRTPTATASVRGTAFEVALDDAASGPTTTVTTTEGRVATTDRPATTEVLVAADQTTTVRANAAPEPPHATPDALRVVTVSVTAENALVIDPLGRANGLRDGRVLAQTPGARVRVENGTLVVTLTNVPDGVFATTVAGSADASVTVSTTVADQGEEPVTITTAAPTGSGPTTSGVEVRRTSDKPEVRALTADESKALDAKVSPAKATVRPGATATPRAVSTTQATPPTEASPERKAEDTPQPAVTPRRTAAPIPSPAPR